MGFRLQFEDLAGNVLDSVPLTDGQITVGRSADCDVTLPSSSVSREHARFFVHLGRPYVEDLRSANGVVVNGMRVRGMQALNGPTVVVIGDHLVRFAPDPVTPGFPQQESAGTHLTDGFLVRLGEDVPGSRIHQLPELARVGRASTAEVHLNDPSVSRLHAELRTAGSSVIVADMGSANGTFVNGTRIQHPTALAESDIVQFGDLSLAFTRRPEQLDWRSIRPPVRGGGDSTRLLIVAAVLAAAVICVAVLVFVSANRHRAPEIDPLMVASDATKSGDWAVAIAAYESALDADPGSQAVITALDRARRELAADNAASACDGHLDAARRLQGGTDTPSAISAFEAARACFEGVEPETNAATRATDTLRTTVLPALVELHRDAGARALSVGSFDDALEHLRTARRFDQARVAGTAAPTDLVAPELRAAYVTAANAAFEAQQWARAESLLSQAHDLAPLDPALATRLDTARTNAARAR